MCEDFRKSAGGRYQYDKAGVSYGLIESVEPGATPYGEISSDKVLGAIRRTLAIIDETQDEGGPE